jgi:hypothetical protein
LAGGSIEAEMLRKTALLLLVVGAAAMGPPDGPEKVEVSSLEMYVDQLPQMPKIYGYNATAANLTVGMFQIKWVRSFPSRMSPLTII